MLYTSQTHTIRVAHRRIKVALVSIGFDIIHGILLSMISSQLLIAYSDFKLSIVLKIIIRAESTSNTTTIARYLHDDVVSENYPKRVISQTSRMLIKSNFSKFHFSRNIVIHRRVTVLNQVSFCNTFGAI